MVGRARAAGIDLQGLSTYYAKHVWNAPPCPPHTVIIGYASLPDEDIQPLAETLRQVWLPAR